MSKFTRLASVGATGTHTLLLEARLSLPLDHSGQLDQTVSEAGARPPGLPVALASAHNLVHGEGRESPLGSGGSDLQATASSQGLWDEAGVGLCLWLPSTRRPRQGWGAA